MELIKNKITDLITDKISICDFCLKNIEDKYFSFDDEIVFDCNTTYKIVDVIVSVLGAKHRGNCVSGIACYKCMGMFLNSYKFITQCIENITLLNDVIQNLDHSVLSADKTNSCKSLFILLNPQANRKQLHYDVNSFKNVTEALERLEKFTTTQTGTEIEMNSDNFSGDSDSNMQCENLNKKNDNTNMKHCKTVKIPLEDIIHNANDMTIIKCKICLNIYPHLYRLKQHFLRVHAPKDFTCSQCSRSYGSAALLTQHKYDSHSSLICSDCGKSYSSRSTFKTHVESHKLKLICQSCGKQFKNQRNFNNHLKLNICDLSTRKIRINKKFVCDYCDKRYSSKNTLRAHITFEHGSGTVHACSWCKKRFNAVSRLTAHIVTHTQEKKFSCEICNGRFVSKESLRYHTRIHTGETPYQCEFCEQKFLSSSRRAEHVRRHHSEPSIDCDICHSKFRSQSYLTRHKNLHFNPNSRLHYTKLNSEDKEL